MPKFNISGMVADARGKLRTIEHHDIPAPSAADARKWFQMQHIGTCDPSQIQAWNVDAEENHATNS